MEWCHWFGHGSFYKFDQNVIAKYFHQLPPIKGFFLFGEYLEYNMNMNRIWIYRPTINILYAWFCLRFPTIKGFLTIISYRLLIFEISWALLVYSCCLFLYKNVVCLDKTLWTDTVKLHSTGWMVPSMAQQGAVFVLAYLDSRQHHTVPRATVIEISKITQRNGLNYVILLVVFCLCVGRKQKLSGWFNGRFQGFFSSR